MLNSIIDWLIVGAFVFDTIFRNCEELRVTRIFSAALLATAIAVAAMVVGWSTPFFSAGAQEASADANVRISAQRLENGRVQFGLRAPDGSGEYADPVEPRLNSFNPASTRTGRWLSSSTLILEVDESGRGRLVPSEQFEPAPPTETPLVSGIEEWAGDIRYSAFHDADGDLVTTVSVYSAATGAPDGELRTTITCQDGKTSVTLGGLSTELGESASAQQFDVSWSVDSGASASERRDAWPVEGGTELITPAESRLAEALLGGGTSLTLSIGTTPGLTTTIDLAALSALPVYNNLIHCAGDAIASAQSGHTELRIRAQLRDDERIEFVVQQRTDDGWSENILPRSRVMRAFGAATDWLSSSPVTVAVPVAPSSHTIHSPDPAERPVREAINPILRSGDRTASISYAAEIGQTAELNSVVTARGERGLELQLGCFGGLLDVQLLGAAADSTGAITLAFDDAQSAANWNVSASDDSAILRPTDTARMIERLRRASSLVVTAGTSAATFDLAGMLETPIQANIDQCGNYTDLNWRPVTNAQNGTTEAGATYWLTYPDWNAGQRATEVSVDASGEAAGPDEQPIRMTIFCWPTRTFQLGHLPSTDGEYTVRSRVDDGEWVDEAWRIFTTDSGWTYANFQTDYERLRSGTTVAYEIPLSPVVRASFNLTALFGTPVQANIDHCGEDPWPQTATYVPIGYAQGRASAAISYSARRAADGAVFTSVTSRITASDAPEGSVTFEVACIENAGLRFKIGRTRAIEGNQTDVILSVDDRPPEISSWGVIRFTNSDLRILFLWGKDAAKLMAQMRGAASVTVEIPAGGLEPLVFDLSGMFDTPVQENLDECGFYRPGETRRLRLDFASRLRLDFATCANDLDDAVSEGSETTDDATIEPSGLMAEAMILVAEAYHWADGVWPGFVPTEQQVVLAHRDAAGEITELLAINVSAPERLGDAVPLATAGTPFCSLVRVDEIEGHALSVLSSIPYWDVQVDLGSQVSGVYVMIVDLSDDLSNPFADQGLDWREYVMHELFHHYQREAFAHNFNQDFKGYAYDAGNLELAALEDRALRAASVAADAEARLQAASHFAGIRFWRAAREPSVTHDERQERIEGTAHYLGRRLGFRWESNGTLLLATDPKELLRVGHGYHHTRVKQYYAFQRFYETGAAIIRLLEQLEVEDVVPRIEAGLSPAQVLADHLGVGEEMAEGLLAEARAVYDPAGKLPALATRLAAAAAKEDWDGPGG